jgi:hypothetical protein
VLRDALTADDAALAHRLRAIADSAGAAHLSIIRTFDIIAWRAAQQTPPDQQSGPPAE